MTTGDDLTAKAHIRKAATRLIADRGFAAVTVRQIAAEAGVSPGLVVHYFGSKQGLLEAVTTHLRDWFDSLLDFHDADGAERAVEARDWSYIIEHARQVFESDSTLPRLLSRMIADNHPAMDAIWDRLFAQSLELTNAYVKRGILTTDPDPPGRVAMMLASDLGNLILRVHLTRSLGYDPYSPDGIHRWAETGARVFSGIFTQPASAEQLETE